MNHPKPVQVRLPFSVPRPKKGVAPEVRVCGICRSKDSRYACPRCNIAYCSLECFRDPKHAQCSEGFYRETVMAEVAQDPGKGPEEKKEVLEMLKRVEAGGEEEEAALRRLMSQGGKEEEDEEEDEDELMRRLADVDLDTIDSNALFRLLPPEHRTKFLAALREPEGAEARRLVELAVEADDAQDAQEPPAPDVLPWWESDVLGDDGEDEDEGAEGLGEKEEENVRPQHAPRPEPIAEDVLRAVKVPEGVGSRLRYNAITVCLAYLHTLLSFRLPSLAPAHLASLGPDAPHVLKDSLGALVPFLTDVRSTVRHETLRAAWSDVWERLLASGPDAASDAQASPPPALLGRLMGMLPGLLHPPIDTDQSPSVLLLLADLYALFERIKSGGAIPRKLAFYSVALRQLSRQEWLQLEQEVRRERRKLDEELGGNAEEEITTPANYLA